MSLTQLNGAGAPRKGPRPKGGSRERLQAKMPTALAHELVKIAGESSVQMTDLGGYLMIRGWNQLRGDQGLPPIPMPSYLEDAVRHYQHAEIQDALIRPEESRLAG